MFCRLTQPTGVLIPSCQSSELSPCGSQPCYKCHASTPGLSYRPWWCQLHRAAQAPVITACSQRFVLGFLLLFHCW